MASASATKSKTPATPPTEAGPAPLPQGFQPPFARVEQAGRADSLQACIATLTGHTVAHVEAEAVAMGFPPNRTFLSEGLVASLCMSLGGLVATRYKEFKSWQHLPAVAIVFGRWDDEFECGMHVVCHTVHATPERKAFRYLIDPGKELPVTHQVHASLDLFEPDYFIGISKASTTAVKGGKA